MGATALANRKVYSDEKTKIFGIRGAHRLQEPVKGDSGFKDQGKDDIRLSLATDEEKDIVFQFKLSKDGSEMIIRAYDPNVPSRGVTEVRSSKPSLDAVMNDPKASQQDKQGAMKIRDMMNRSKSGIKESSLAKIANELKKKKAKGGRKS